MDLRIIDRGVGVPRDQRARIFEPFQRLGDEANPRHGTGVGLGLAVARGLVEAMDGRLILGDTPGGRLTAIIELFQAESPMPTPMPLPIVSSEPSSVSLVPGSTS
jgi:two-component system, OmpR family, sensor histidine kinase KdpD